MTTIKERKKDIRTVRKEMKQLGFTNMKFSTLMNHHERFVVPNPELYGEKFIKGTIKDKCDFAKVFIFQATDGEWMEEDLLAFELDGFKLLEFANPNWADGSPRKFRQPNAHQQF